MEIFFTKMNGAGNDFVVVDNRSLELGLGRGDIARLCDRHRGVGADGLLVVEPAQAGADYRMRYYNSDGGEADMCGNGARCFARFAQRLLGDGREQVSFETPAGVIVAQCQSEQVSLSMGSVKNMALARELLVQGRRLEVFSLNTGVPHAVVFVDALDSVDVVADGAAIRYHETFAPAGTNANFAKIESPGCLALRTYERGVEGETLACGTGVCAAALLYAEVTGAASPVSVRVRGGDTLSVAFERKADGQYEKVVLTGPADFVFDGKFY